MATGKLLNADRGDRIPRALKAERQHHVITHNPSEISPKQTLYVYIAKLKENTFFIPNSMFLSADVILSGNSSNHVVNNLGRNLVKDLKVKWGAETILDIEDYHLYLTFKELWLTKE